MSLFCAHISLFFLSRLSIAPWNAPLTLAARAVAVPLICGNTVVLKSSEYSPRIHEILVEVMHEVSSYSYSP